MATFMGLDISSTTVGISLIDFNEDLKKPTLLKCEYYKPPKDGDIFSSLRETREFFTNKIKEYNPDKIVIEEALKHFGGKLSSADTLIKLNIYNYTIGLVCYEYLGKSPTLLNVNTCRAVLRPKNYPGKLAKEDVPKVIEKLLNIPFPYVYKKNGNISEVSMDMADAVAIALADIYLELSKNNPKPSKKKKVDKSE
jgi:Holliday junction resolvasome RuvABC endonuclease subunit